MEKRVAEELKEEFDNVMNKVAADMMTGPKEAKYAFSAVMAMQLGRAMAVLPEGVGNALMKLVLVEKETIELRIERVLQRVEAGESLQAAAAGMRAEEILEDIQAKGDGR